MEEGRSNKEGGEKTETKNAPDGPVKSEENNESEESKKLKRDIETLKQRTPLHKKFAEEHNIAIQCIVQGLIPPHYQFYMHGVPLRSREDIDLFFDFLELTPLLTYFSLMGCYLEDGFAPIFRDRLNNFPGFIGTNISENPNIGNIGILTIASAPLFTNIEILYIGKTGIDDQLFLRDVGDIHQPPVLELSRLINLKEFNFSCNAITHRGFHIFCENLRYLRKLTKLWVNGNPIQDEGLMDLCRKLTDIPNLKVLNVTDCQITDVGCNCVISKISARQLDYLSIKDSNHLGRDCLEDLKNFSKENHIQLR